MALEKFQHSQLKTCPLLTASITTYEGPVQAIFESGSTRISTFLLTNKVNRMDHNATASVEEEPLEFRDVEISREPFELYKILKGNVEKSRQRRSRPFAVLTY